MDTIVELLDERGIARDAGARKYSPLEPCKRGHTSGRYVSDGKCVACRSESGAPLRIATREQACLRAAAYRAANPEKARAAVAMWTAQNRERKQAVDRAYGNAHSQERCRRASAWMKANPESKRAYAENRRALKLLSIGSYTGADIKEIHRLQRGRCANPVCRDKVGKNYHIDHIIPLKLGGSNERRNIQILCPPCNRSKGARHPIDFAKLNGGLL